MFSVSVSVLCIYKAMVRPHFEYCSQSGAVRPGVRWLREHDLRAERTLVLSGDRESAVEETLEFRKISDAATSCERAFLYCVTVWNTVYCDAVNIPSGVLVYIHICEFYKMQ